MAFAYHLLVGFLVVDTWETNYPDCGKSSQSPIDIVRDDANVDNELPIIDRKIFDTPPTRMSIENNGHSLKIIFDEGGYELVDSKLLPFKAKIDHYHLHWGSNATSAGAEHTIDGKQYFAELHAVHYNTKYANVGEAMTKPDGLAVFGWFVDVDYPQINQDFYNMQTIAENGASQTGNATNVLAPFSLETMVPADLSRYYRYKGSLTTPGCYETVVWTVFDEPIRISKIQATYLSRNFLGSNGDPIIDNFRVVQPLNGRQVTKPPPLVPKSSGATITASTFLLSFTAILLALLY